MYNAEQVINGLINYTDSEIMAKLPTSGKWIVGTIMGLTMTKIDNIVNSLVTNSAIKMLGVVDEDGMIDMDAVLESLKESADKYGKLSVSIPMMGNMSFSSADIEALKRYIV